MRVFKIGDSINIDGCNFDITRIRWSEKNKGELIDKEEVLYPALDWCILDTSEGERLRVESTGNGIFYLIEYLKNGVFIKSNQYGFSPAKTYWYILNKIDEIYHHKDKKWRKKCLKEMTTYAYYNAGAAIKAMQTIQPSKNTAYNQPINVN